MKISNAGLSLIKKFEGCQLKPYLCPAKIETIGWGSTLYEDGTKVSMKNPAISQDRADKLLLNTLKQYEEAVDYSVIQNISQNQFDALVSFCYNVGAGNLKTSTLLKLVNSNPNDKNIETQFLRWNKGGGKELAGLTKRRQAEANLYFNKK